MINNQKTKTPMKEQAADIRNKNFEEVNLGYNEKEAINEANRCLGCKNARCIEGCPVNINIPEFIRKIKEKDYVESYKVINHSNSLPAICGRVCPQENQCEKNCVRGIKGESVAIGRLERFVADYCRSSNLKDTETIAKNNHKVAIVGSGPAGLACAADLAKLGYKVTIFEALHLPGGVLAYGIPEFRLPRKILNYEIEKLKNMGVEIKTNMVIGNILSLEDLFNDYNYQSVFIGSGAGVPKFMNIPGENLNGVFSANEFLTRINLMKIHKNFDTPINKIKNIAIVGGGNVAMDAARCAKRLLAENVYLIYRRSLNEMPARKEEVNHAQEEGIQLLSLTNPVKIHGENGCVKQIECKKMRLSEPDESNRARPIEIENSNFLLEVDSVIMAIGTSPNPLLTNVVKGLETNQKGCLVVNKETNETSLPGVFAGGDAVSGAATVILAMGAGKLAAKSIDEYIKNKKSMK